MDPEEGLRLLVAEYDRRAAAYEARAVPYYRPLAEALLASVSVGEGEAVLDVECGTENLAFQAARRAGPSGSVVGVDLARGMVRLARWKALEENLPAVRFLRMDARRLAL